MDIKITNKTIYDEIIGLKEHVIKTNGKVKLNKWIATTALSLTVIVIGLLMSAGMSTLVLVGLLV